MSISRNKRGLPPGTVVFTGDRKVDKIEIHYLQYDTSYIEEKILNNQARIVFQPSSDEKVDWYDIRGIHDTLLIENIGSAFDIHPLILEDISDTHQRPKLDEYEKGILIILKALTFDKSIYKITKEQVAIYFRKGLVVTFQETESDLFLSVRKRIHSGKGKVRQRGADYLVYALIDVLVGNYYQVLEDFDEEIELFEEKVLESQDSDIRSGLHLLKKELLVMRKSVAPLRESIGRFAKTDSSFIDESTSIYIRDLYDQTIQVMDNIESFRDLLNGLQDLFISELSFKMNKVMQVLTIVSTIFIPLTFLAGIYGMNFVNIPELQWKYGYFILLGLMILIFLTLLLFFKKRKWF